MSAADVTATWRRIEGWLSRHAPDIAADLNPPATQEALADAEHRIGRTLPADVRSSFRIHDGQGGSAPWSFPEWRLLPVSLVVDQFELLRDLKSKGIFDAAVPRVEGPLKPEWWSPGWIPLGSNGSGDNLCVDLDPPAGGRIGQLVEYWGRDEQRKVVAASFSDWLSSFADDLDAGRIGRDENGSLIRLRK